jgi:hypothetical protein
MHKRICGYTYVYMCVCVYLSDLIVFFCFVSFFSISFQTINRLQVFIQTKTKRKKNNNIELSLLKL